MKNENLYKLFFIIIAIKSFQLLIKICEKYKQIIMFEIKMKRIILFPFFLFSTFLFGQDIIFLNDGTEIKSKVTEVNEFEIKFYKHSSPNGPLYSKSKSEIILIKYENGQKDVFKSKDNALEFTIKAGEQIALYLTKTISSANIRNGSIIYFAVKDPILSKNNKVIIAANTPVQGRVVKVQNARWLGQKGELDIQINSIKATDGTSIPVYYNITDEGKGRSIESIGIGALLFWPALFLKGKQAEIVEGTVLFVSTRNDITFDTSKFDLYDSSNKKYPIPSNENYDVYQNQSNLKKYYKPKREDFRKRSEFKKALKKYEYDRKYFEPQKRNYSNSREYKKAMRDYYSNEDYFEFEE